MLSVNFNPFPELKTPRLTLREIKEQDVNEVFFLRSDKEVLKYINKPPATSLDDARDFISRVNALAEKGEGINWTITINGDDKLIGNIGIWNFTAEHYRGEIGYVMHPAHHGKGIMNEAMIAVLDYGFRVMKLHSIEANVNPANTPSIKLLERNKFVREAYFRENHFFEGRFLDTAVYSLLSQLGKTD